jgi:hypothetical protein
MGGKSSSIAVRVSSTAISDLACVGLMVSLSPSLRVLAQREMENGRSPLV